MTDTDAELRDVLNRAIRGLHTVAHRRSFEECGTLVCADARAALALDPIAVSDESDNRPCPACGAPLRPDETHWSLMPAPMGGYVCPVAPPRRCGCGHEEARHFPACLANVEDKPWTDFAAPFDLETMRWGHNYVCGCPAFGSPGGASLGKRRAKNHATRSVGVG